MNLEADEVDALLVDMLWVRLVELDPGLLPGAGPHILTVASSEALAIIEGLAGFQCTQFTV